MYVAAMRVAPRGHNAHRRSDEDYSPLAPNSLKTRTARSWALLTASAGALPPSTSPNMSVQKLDDSSDCTHGCGGAGYDPTPVYLDGWFRYWRHTSVTWVPASLA